jgi:hypothetical protein
MLMLSHQMDNTETPLKEGPGHPYARPERPRDPNHVPHCNRCNELRCLVAVTAQHWDCCLDHEGYIAGYGGVRMCKYLLRIRRTLQRDFAKTELRWVLPHQAHRGSMCGRMQLPLPFGR